MKTILFASALALISTTAMAQAPGGDLPACSRSVTDKCIQKGGSEGWHHAGAGHHGGKGHHWHGKHHRHHWHKKHHIKK